MPGMPDFYRQHPEIDIIPSNSDHRRDMFWCGLDCVLWVGELGDGDYMARWERSCKMRYLAFFELELSNNCSLPGMHEQADTIPSIHLSMCIIY